MVKKMTGDAKKFEEVTVEQAKEKFDNKLGRCPLCGGVGVLRESILDGMDICENGHRYKSTEAVYS